MKSIQLGSRRYFAHVPRRLGKSPALVIALHAGAQTPEGFERMTGWSTIADRERSFVVVYPEGIGHSWNAGNGALGRAGRVSVDDVGFIDEVISDTGARWAINRARVFLSGFSNGSMLAHRIAAVGPHHITGIAGVSGGFSRLPGPPSFVDPPAVRMVHGRADDHVPFAGGVGADAYDRYDHLPIEQTASWWRGQGADVHTIWHSGGHEWRAGETEDQWAWMRGLA